MKKRIRKKLHKGEFKETGFNLKCIFNDKVQESGFDQFIDNFITAIEVKGLTFGGSGSLKSSWEGIIAKEKSYTCTEQSDKEYISNWLKHKNELKDFFIGEDTDLWYPED
ncbi:MAG: 50S ribosome-binding protein YggL [Ignavibacteria bacterium]|nr:50S ribosome-binding protein YggL [Ignavibacteria bacterium]